MVVDCVFGALDLRCEGTDARSRVMNDMTSVGHKHTISWNLMHCYTK